MQGGAKAVVYTDVPQVVLLVVGVLVVTVMGCIKVGGVNNVWSVAEQGDRIEFFK